MTKAFTAITADRTKLSLLGGEKWAFALLAEASVCLFSYGKLHLAKLATYNLGSCSYGTCSLIYDCNTRHVLSSFFFWLVADKANVVQRLDKGSVFA